MFEFCKKLKKKNIWTSSYYQCGEHTPSCVRPANIYIHVQYDFDCNLTLTCIDCQRTQSIWRVCNTQIAFYSTAKWNSFIFFHLCLRCINGPVLFWNLVETTRPFFEHKFQFDWISCTFMCDRINFRPSLSTTVDRQTPRVSFFLCVCKCVSKIWSINKI